MVRWGGMKEWGSTFSEEKARGHRMKNSEREDKEVSNICNVNEYSNLRKTSEENISVSKYAIAAFLKGYTS